MKDFIAEGGLVPWRWGEHDCTIRPADWVLERRGLDPAFSFRSAYATAEECRALLKREGGLVRLVSRAMAECGLAETAAPVLGDVGIVSAPIAVRGRRVLNAPVGAICAGDGQWAVLLENQGYGVGEATPLAAWSV